MPRSKHLSPNRDLLRKAEVADILGVSVITVTRWVKTGKFIRPIYITPNAPGRWRRRDVDAFIDKAKASRAPRPKPRGAAAQHAQ